MGHTLILTDDAARGRRLAALAGGDRARVHDIYGDGEPPGGPGLIIADVSAATSDSVLRLRRTLARVRMPGTPFVYLIHGNSVRGEIQASALGADATLAASAAAALLSRTAADLRAGAAPAAAVTPQRHVAAARAAFTAIFTGRDAPAPDLVDTGTLLVTRAIREVGTRDWLDVVARFDDVTHRHCLTVAGLAAAFAGTLGLGDHDSHRFTKGALLHDIGKARVPLDILNKAGPLTDAERTEINRHPVLGYEMLAGGAYDPGMLAVVRSHHEYLDGTGYPDGLAGGHISDLVRLVTICDIFAALIEWRPYKAAKSAGQAYAILRGMERRLDPVLVEAFGAVVAACGGSEIAASA